MRRTTSKQMSNKAAIRLPRVYCKYLGIFTKYAKKLSAI